jgi:hypothetical protein
LLKLGIGYIEKIEARDEGKWIWNL